MSKLLFYVCIALLVGTVISASTGQRPGSSAGPTCKSHGDPCRVVEECCPNLWCLTYAGKCVGKQSGAWREGNSTVPVEESAEKSSTSENDGPKNKIDS